MIQSRATITQLSVSSIVLSLYKKEKKTFSKEEFKQWLVGFIDAEGNFQVFMDRNYVRVMFRINLHIDALRRKILQKIKEFLGVGKVIIGKSSAVYVISNTTDLINVLFPILDQYKLLTTKYLDYLDFCKVVKKLVITNNSVFIDSDLTFVKDTIKNMNSGRYVINYELIPNTPVTLFWGFIEGEGGLKILYLTFKQDRTKYSKQSCSYENFEISKFTIK